MDNMDIISIIGCLTGATSLFASIKHELFLKGKVYVEQSDESRCYYFDTNKCDQVSGWEDTTFPAVLSMQITNSSSYPVSITKAFLRKKDIKVFHGNNFNHTRIGVFPNSMDIIPQDYIGKAKFLQPHELTNLPLKIAPFDSVQVAFAFPYASKLITHYGETISATLELHTSRNKKIKTPVKIVEYLAHFTETSF